MPSFLLLAKVFFKWILEAFILTVEFLGSRVWALEAKGEACYYLLGFLVVDRVFIILSYSWILDFKFNCSFFNCSTTEFNSFNLLVSSDKGLCSSALDGASPDFSSSRTVRDYSNLSLCEVSKRGTGISVIYSISATYLVGWPGVAKAWDWSECCWAEDCLDILEGENTRLRLPIAPLGGFSSVATLVEGEHSSVLHGEAESKVLLRIVSGYLSSSISF